MAAPATAPRAPSVLSAFGRELARRLAINWESTDLDWSEQDRRRAVTDFLWDQGVMQHVVATYVLTRAVLLTSDDYTQLLVIDRPRPRHRGQVLIGALTPVGLDLAGRDLPRIPMGIAVPRDPARAAYEVITRLLPDYYGARHALLALPPKMFIPLGDRPRPRPLKAALPAPRPASSAAAAGVRR